MKISATSRCQWCGDDLLYQHYHDHEWGVPLHDDQQLFEFLILEGFQAGLSWITILRKREAFRAAFAGFDPHKVAAFDQQDIERLMQDTGIVRNRLKINAAINNARCFLTIQTEVGSFDQWIWRYVDHQPIINHWQAHADIPVHTPLAETISRDLKKRGFTFVGPTVIYSHMQATGMINDHVTGCFRHAQLTS